MKILLLKYTSIIWIFQDGSKQRILKALHRGFWMKNSKPPDHWNQCSTGPLPTRPNPNLKEFLPPLASVVFNFQNVPRKTHHIEHPSLTGVFFIPKSERDCTTTSAPRHWPTFDGLGRARRFLVRGRRRRLDVTTTSSSVG